MPKKINCPQCGTKLISVQGSSTTFNRPTNIRVSKTEAGTVSDKASVICPECGHEFAIDLYELPGIRPPPN